MRTVKRFRCADFTCVAAVALLGVRAARSDSGEWTGAASSAWTNSANWSVSPYPSGSEEATFSGGGSGNTVLDLLGLPSIKYITFATPGVAEYTVGAGGPNGQTLMLEKNTGTIRLGSDAESGQMFHAAIQLGTDTATGSYGFVNDSASKTLTFAGIVSGAPSGGTPGTKTLTVSGSGSTLISGSISNGGANPVKLVSDSAGGLTLSAANAFSGDTEILSGSLILKHPGALGGTYRVNIKSDTPAARLEWAHDGVGETPFNVIIAVGLSGTLVSGVGAGTVGINHALGELSLSGSTMNAMRAANVTSGSPSISAQSVVLNGNSAYTSILNPTTADFIFGSVSITNGNYKKVLALDGTSQGNRINGVITNGLHTISVRKSNSSTWTLAGENVYTGATTVTGGALALSGRDGAIKRSTGVTVSGNALLQLDNAANNNADRLGDAMPVVLNGGTFRFSHSGGAADYSETAGELTVGQGANTISSAQAASGRSSALTFSALTYGGGTAKFDGAGLGVNAQNQVLFSTPPALDATGIIGTWATVSDGAFATYGAYGITAFTNYTDVAARGPSSTIPDSANAHVRILDDGTAGAIALAGALTNRVSSLRQANTNVPAVVDTASKTLLASGLYVAPGGAALTIGANADSGSLSAPSSGGTLALNNNSTNELTISAALADSSTTALLSQSGLGPVVFNGSFAHTGPIVVNEGTLAFGGHVVSQRVAGVISGAGSLVKRGTNVLHVLAANTYTGPTTISQGIFRAYRSTAFGDTALGDVFIEDGATLDMGGAASADSVDFGTQHFTVNGAGADGNGAIVNNSSLRQIDAFGQIALAGNTTIGGTADWRIQNNTPTVTLNGYTLTKAGANMIEFYNTSVLPGSGHISVTGGIFRILYNTSLNGGASNTLTVQKGAELQVYRLAFPQSWTMIMEGGATLNVGSSNGSAQNRWAGPVLLKGVALLTGASAYIADIQGPISGTGSVVKTGSSVITLSCTNSAYVGGTTVSNGTLVAGSPGSLPGYATGTVTVVGGARLDLRTGNGTLGWNGAQIDALHDASTFTASTAVLGIDSTLADLDYTYDITKAISLSKYGTGALTLSGTNSFTGPLNLDAGTLVLAGSNALSGTMYVNAGKLLLSGQLNQGSAAGNVIGSSSGNAVLRLTTGSSMTGTGKFNVGRDSGNSGALYLDDGNFVRNTSTGDSDYFCFGFNGGYGYLKMSGGKLSATRFQLGTTDGTTLGVGMVRMTGGTLQCANTFHISRNTNSVGVLTIDGGTLNHSNASTFIQMGYRGGRGELNLTGGNLINDLQTIQVRYSSGNSTGIVNLCAGQLSLDAFLNNSTGTAWLNFRGGTLKASANATAFIPSTMSGVYSYGPLGAFAGGAVIDTAGKDVTVAAPIQAPGGSGITAVNLSHPGSGLIGEPYVSITGGGGFGAAAVANMVDDGTGNGTYRVASVTITSPGVGYTSDPTVAFVRGGNSAVAPTGSVTRAANTSGGLTKLGAGTLTLSAANTYTGATTLAGGTLKLTNAKALPTQTSVVLDGGLLDLNGYTVTNALSGIGTITNGTVQAVISPAGAGMIGTNTLRLASATLRGTYLADVTTDGASDFVTVQGNLNLSDLALQIVDPEQLDRQEQYTLLTCSGALSGTLETTNLQDRRWHIYRLANTVKLAFSDGLVIRLL